MGIYLTSEVISFAAITYSNILKWCLFLLVFPLASDKKKSDIVLRNMRSNKWPVLKIEGHLWVASASSLKPRLPNSFK